MGFRWILFCFGLLFIVPASHAENLVKAVRIWPSPVYTRIVIESSHPIPYHLFKLQNPQRVVLDLHQVKFRGVIETLPALLNSNNPDISEIRVGRFNPETVRIVLAIKHPVEPVLANLKPIANYGYRLVLDIYPKQPMDAIARLALPGNVSPARELPPSVREEPPRMATQHDIIVAIDPGHGGEDPGAHGPDGVLEKNVTLAIAYKLKAAIDRLPGMKAELTRTGDYYVPLQMRVIEAHKMHADLFVSIHANSQPYGDSATGTAVYALSEHGATSAAARLLARNENSSDSIGGVTLPMHDTDLAKTLVNLEQSATIDDSIKLGNDVLSKVEKFHSLHYKRVQQAAFVVLKSLDIPSILVETAFISNPVEEARLNSPVFQKEMARAIAQGLYKYVQSDPSFEQQLANNQ